MKYPKEVGSPCFSPDGSKYVFLNYDTGLNIYDFDRCSGLISNPLNLPMPSIADSVWLGLGIAISPNSRYLYVNANRQLYQFDLHADDVFGSVDTIGRYDGTKAPFNAVFHLEQLAPDGKIYISCGSADTVYHVINYPDRKGDSCNFVQRGLGMKAYCNSLPNFPNYRLGKLPGSACDTLWSDNDEIKIQQREKILKVFPNPANSVITIDYGFTDWSKNGNVVLEIVNELGQIVYNAPVPQYSGFQKIDVNGFVAGVYTACIKRGGGLVAVQKFAKE